jgi:hypothetical protein
MSNTLKKTWMPILFVACHTVLAVLLHVAILSSSDGEAGMAWWIFLVIDWPMTAILFSERASEGELFFNVLFLGGFQWLAIGTVVQLIMNEIDSRARPRRK